MHATRLAVAAAELAPTSAPPDPSRGRSALVDGPGSVGSRIAVMLRAVGMTVDGAGRHSRPAAGRTADGRPLWNVVDKRLGYVGSHPSPTAVDGALRKGSSGR